MALKADLKAPVMARRVSTRMRNRLIPKLMVLVPVSRVMINKNNYRKDKRIHNFCWWGTCPEHYEYDPSAAAEKEDELRQNILPSLCS